MIVPPLEKILVEISDELSLPITPRQYAEELVMAVEVDDATRELTSDMIAKYIQRIRASDLPSQYIDFLEEIITDILISEGVISPFQWSQAISGKPFHFAYIRCIGKGNATIKGNEDCNMYGLIPDIDENLDCSPDNIDGIIKADNYCELVTLSSSKNRRELNLRYFSDNRKIIVPLSLIYEHDAPFQSVFRYNEKSLEDVEAEFKGTLRDFISNYCSFLF